MALVLGILLVLGIVAIARAAPTRSVVPLSPGGATMPLSYIYLVAYCASGTTETTLASVLYQSTPAMGAAQAKTVAESVLSGFLSSPIAKAWQLAPGGARVVSWAPSFRVLVTDRPATDPSFKVVAVADSRDRSSPTYIAACIPDGTWTLNYRDTNGLQVTFGYYLQPPITDVLGQVQGDVDGAASRIASAGGTDFQIYALDGSNNVVAKRTLGNGPV